ncbi:MAG: hypothetical protein SOR77_01870 [Peptoniphilus sp.]|uniref:hypothetical protein n=1 Tax=Peptoniphilus sp. TaxID=1971214 RepID=UPI002A764719|nr:hypothetical protein [Peptoniphilus sp.]MDY2986361.1 hypothetical protein [Peptoniphilus sp.]
MNKYSPVLKKMIDFTNIKLIVLANELDYDISYISKWCNASKLPSQKYIRTTNKKISEVLSREIFEQNKVLDFFLEFDIKLPENSNYLEDSKFIEEKINKILMKEYKDSIKNYDSVENNTRMVIGNSNIKLFLSDVIQKQNLKNEEAFTDLLITMDFISDGVEYILNLISEVKNINIKIGLDVDDLEGEKSEKLKKLYQLLNDKSNLNVTMYKNSEFKYFNAIIAKNNFVINYSLDKNKKMEIISYSNDEEEVDKAYKILAAKFKNENILMKNVSSLEMNRSGYRTDFYTDNHFNMFCCYGFEFLLPSEIIEDIAKKECENIKKRENKDFNVLENMLQIKKLQIEWEEIFHERNINFFIPKVSLYKYIQTGKLVYIDTEYTMSIEQRKEHFFNVIRLMKKNKNIKIYIIDGEKVSGDFKEFNIGIYLNQKKFFIKNYARFFKNLEPFIHTVIDKNLVDGVNKFLENLKNGDNCREYTVEELEEKWNNYGNMFLKIMEISSENVED